MPATPTPWLDLLLQANILKTTPRTGWYLRWVPRPEDVAAHSWGTAMVALVLAQMTGEDLDRGRQYRPEIFYADEAQRAAAEISKRALEESGRFDDPISYLDGYLYTQGRRIPILNETEPGSVPRKESVPW